MNRITVEEEREEESQSEEENQEENKGNVAETSPKWREYSGRHKILIFTGTEGTQRYILPPNNVTPENVFKLFVSEKVFELLVTQTNLYADQMTALKTNDQMTTLKTNELCISIKCQGRGQFLLWPL